MKHVHLATALCVREGRVLLVASRYPNHPQPLWNLPGGRQQSGELLAETAVRECLEETGYRAQIRELAYVSESYDRTEGVHFVNAAFSVTLQETDARAKDDDHVVDIEWVAVGDVASRIVVPVVRDPLLAYLRGEMPQRYAGFEDSGITIRWPSDSR
ncbi:MAG TPA: NUDIX domain-containing protein [Candidatus Baltobacteraceae bacterium]|nr:NUDIX domain-containing protein [Candidatus Baltobacteraceae bacterium]